jgi:glucose/mannose-6-phosphate isomerase
MDHQVASSDGDRRKEILSLAGKYDKFNMARVIETTAEQIAYALSAPDLPDLGGRSFERAVIAGMGGSALPVEVLQDAFSDQLRAPLRAWRHYGLPSWVDERTLVIASSLSGETEETLSAAESPQAEAATTIALTAGEDLAELARERGYPVVRIPVEREPDGFQPRSATGYMVTYMARILAAAGILEDPAPALKSLVAFLRALDVRSEAEEVAYWFGDRIPIFYTDATHESSVARIAKVKHNENSKRPAFFNCLPEANHNEMIGLERPFGEFACLYLRDPDSHSCVHLRFKAMREVFGKRKIDHIEFREWTMPGGNRLEKIFSGLMFADWSSYTLALLDGQDPTPVPLVQEFKQTLDGSREG